MAENLLTIKDLNVALPNGSDREFAVQNINLNIKIEINIIKIIS